MWNKIPEHHKLPMPVEELIEQNRLESIRYFPELDENPCHARASRSLGKTPDKKLIPGCSFIFLS